MKFADVANIWSVDLRLLSNADRARVYFERAKQVVAEAFDDPVRLSKAVQGTRFRRTYLVKNIGCQPAVPQQNPKIRSLLADADSRLRQELSRGGAGAPFHGIEPASVGELRATIHALRQRLEIVERENLDLQVRLSRK